jgi:hypothetical protein
VIPIAYGTHNDWVRNVLTAGGGHLVHRRVRYAVRDPQLLTGGAGPALLARPLRTLTKLVRAQHVLRVAADRV